MEEPRYDTIGEGYARRRRPDPRIAAAIERALGDARTVINVGAGAGSYEPRDRVVQAVEPSETMIAQRAADAAPCVRASAEALPFADRSFDAAMAILTIHHWSDWRAGVREMRRVASRIVVLTFDVEASNFWLNDYVPELAALDRAIMPKLDALATELGAPTIEVLEIPSDCEDGFLGAYWRHPDVYLDPIARRSMSSFARVDATAGLARLAHDLESGAWAARYGGLTSRESLDVGYRLLRWADPHA